MVLAGDIVIHIPLLVPGKTQTSEKFMLFSQEKKACFVDHLLIYQQEKSITLKFSVISPIKGYVRYIFCYLAF